MTTSRETLFNVLNEYPVYNALNEVDKEKERPADLQPVIYDETNYRELLALCRQRLRDKGNTDPNALLCIRYVVTIEGKLRFGMSGIPSVRNNIPSHKDVAGSNKCRFAGDLSFNIADEGEELNNHSGRFKTGSDAIHIGAMELHKAKIKFAEKTRLRITAPGIGKGATHHYSRKRLIKKIEKIIPHYQALKNVADQNLSNQTTTTSSSSEDIVSPFKIPQPRQRRSPLDEEKSPASTPKKPLRSSARYSQMHATPIKHRRLFVTDSRMDIPTDTSSIDSPPLLTKRKLDTTPPQSTSSSSALIFAKLPPRDPKLAETAKTMINAKSAKIHNSSTTTSVSHFEYLNYYNNPNLLPDITQFNINSAESAPTVTYDTDSCPSTPSTPASDAKRLKR